MSDSDNIKVAVRMRPMSKIELCNNNSSPVEYLIDGDRIYVRDYGFVFDYVFGPDTDQQLFYDSTIRDQMIPKLFLGFNVTILAYGQTGSGKTYTMGTSYTKNSEMGVIERVLKDIFDYFENNELDYGISVSFIEIYNETIYDLLSDKPRDQTVLEIREENREFKCVGLTEKSINSVQEGFDLLIMRSKCRSTGSTAMNETSSRSHAVFTVNLTIKNIGEPHVITSKFHLVDLAGSERQKKAEVHGERFKEDVNINLSLLALGNVISALCNENARNSFVSYRESKLTRLLQNSLGGNSITLMIACISSANMNLEETLSTLRYADKVKSIRNRPIINKHLQINEVTALKEYITELELQLDSFRNLKLPSGDFVEDKVTIAMLENKLQDSIFNERVIHLVHSLKTLSSQVLSDLNENKSSTEFKTNLIKLQSLFDEYMNEKYEIDEHVNIVRIETEIGTQEKAYSLEQCKSALKLKEIDYQIQQKEKEIQEVEDRSDFMHKEAEKLFQNKVELQKLRLEYDGIMEKIREAKMNHTSSKQHIQRRVRQTELEVLIPDIVKKISEQEWFLKRNERDAKIVEKLRDDVQEIKRDKIKLVKSMQAETDRFRDWKKKKENEISQLKSFSRKRTFFKTDVLLPKENIDTDLIVRIQYSPNQKKIVDISLRNGKYNEPQADELKEIIKQLQNHCEMAKNEQNIDTVDESKVCDCNLQTSSDDDFINHVTCSKEADSKFLDNLQNLLRI